MFLKTYPSTWHGETGIASYATDSGIWHVALDGFMPNLQNMFDDEASESIWHSHLDSYATVRTLTINFHEEIDFEYLKIKKRSAASDSRSPTAYLNVCLVLDNDITNQLCTDQQKGFSDSDNDNINWNLPTIDVSKVELVFRDTNTYGNQISGHAMVRDLKIFFSENPSKFQISNIWVATT